MSRIACVTTHDGEVAVTITAHALMRFYERFGRLAAGMPGDRARRLLAGVAIVGAPGRAADDARTATARVHRRDTGRWCTVLLDEQPSGLVVVTVIAAERWVSSDVR